MPENPKPPWKAVILIAGSDLSDSEKKVVIDLLLKDVK